MRGEALIFVCSYGCVVGPAARTEYIFLLEQLDRRINMTRADLPEAHSSIKIRIGLKGLRLIPLCCVCYKILTLIIYYNILDTVM